MTLGKKRWIVAALLLAFATAAYALNPFADARSTVRLVTGTDGGSCSAVVIAPEVALTARHCEVITGMLVDGKPAKIVKSHAVEDVTLLSVPGLACPCVEVSTVRPMLDETMLFIGWLYGDFKMTTRGEYLGTTKDEGATYGVGVAPAGPGMSGGGAVRYVEVSKDTFHW